MSRTSDYLGGAAGPMPVGSPGGGGLGAYPAESYQTARLDLTVANLGVELIPAKPGYVPLITNINWILDAVSGTQTSVAAGNMGSNAAHTNAVTSFSSPSNANINAIATVPASLGSSASTIAANTVQRIPNAAVLLDIPTPAAGTGGFVLRGRVEVLVLWIPAGGQTTFMTSSGSQIDVG